MDPGLPIPLRNRRENRSLKRQSNGKSPDAFNRDLAENQKDIMQRESILGP